MIPLLFSVVACGQPAPATPSEEVVVEEPAPPSQDVPPPLSWTVDPELAKAGVTIEEALPPPYGAERVEADAFGLWLRQRPLAHADAPVLAYDGSRVSPPTPWRVVQLPLVPGDLQQCADAILRMRAEWLKETGQPISFHATSGDPIPWERYQAGEDPYDAGNRIAWRAGSDQTWDGYLTKVFTWAGSWSLQNLETRPATHPRAGMILVQGGFPGHAVLLMDVAQQGDTLYILAAQSFMPAQSFHMDLGPHAGWWEFQQDLELGTWYFFSSDLREWKPDGA